AAHVEHPVVLECAERDTVIAAARHSPSFELEPQRLGQRVRVGRRGGGDEFGNRRGDFVRQSVECTDRSRRQLDRPGRIPAWRTVFVSLLPLTVWNPRLPGG